MRNRSALWAATHPLPWWVVMIPALIVCLATLSPYLGVGGWLYVAPARLSSLAHDSVFISGAIAAMVSAWIADRFDNRHGLSGAPSNGRPHWRQSGRILLTIVGWWITAQVATAAVATFSWMRQATGGHIFVADIAVAAAGLSFFIMSGYLIGVAVARWYSPLVALAWAAVVDFVVPVLVSSFLPWAKTNLEFYLFPAMVQQDHQELRASVMVVVGAWWLAVLMALALCVLLFPRDRRPGSHALFGGGLAVLAALGGAVAYLPHLLPSPFEEGAAEPIVCRDLRGGLNVCVTEAQSRGLGPLIAQISPIVDKMGSAWPTQVTTIASDDAARSLQGKGVQESEIAWTSISSYGVDNAKGSLATSLSGTHVCQSVGGSPTWGYAFADWLAPGPYSLPPDDPTMAAFLDQPDAQVLQWYQENSAALLACRYDGPGPT